jgi:hypothetical protein
MHVQKESRIIALSKKTFNKTMRQSAGLCYFLNTKNNKVNALNGKKGVYKVYYIKIIFKFSYKEGLCTNLQVMLQQKK